MAWLYLAACIMNFLAGSVVLTQDGVTWLFMLHAVLSAIFLIAFGIRISGRSE